VLGVLDGAVVVEVPTAVDVVEIAAELEVVGLATVKVVELIDSDPVLETLGFGEP
jgi:hypothetical protein